MEGNGTFIDNIEKDSKTGNSYICKSGKEAILDYNVLKYDKNNDCTLVSVDLKTGRRFRWQTDLFI